MKRIDPRAIAGGGIFGLALMILVMIYNKPELAKDDLFKMLAQAIVTQGLIGLAMAFYFTAQHRTPPTGQAGDPVHVEDDSDKGAEQ